MDAKELYTLTKTVRKFGLKVETRGELVNVVYALMNGVQELAREIDYVVLRKLCNEINSVDADEIKEMGTFSLRNADENRQKLFDILANDKDGSFDLYDNTFDTSGCSIGYPDNPDNDKYDMFIECLAKTLDVVNANETELTVDWVKLIMDNFDAFKSFSFSNWSSYPDDEDDFCEEWIHEFEKLVTGYGNDSVYKKFIDFLPTLRY